jgi:hypothetical protein
MFHEAIQRALETGGDLGAAMAEAATPMRQVIETMLRQQPFEPFRIHMTGRYVHEIRRPETVIVRPTTLHVGEPDPARPGELHARVILALIHVVSLEPLTADEPTVIQHTR